MQIQLKQNEIEEALRDFITKQGIRLQGLEVSMVFTSGRKDKGLTVDMDIPDLSPFPEYADESKPEEINTPERHLKAINPTPSYDAAEEPEEADLAPEHAPPEIEMEEVPKSNSIFGA